MSTTSIELSRSSWITRVLLFAVFTIPLALTWHFLQDTPTRIFCTIFILRYARLVGHIIGYLLYRPAPQPRQPPAPRFSCRDVTVILPTIDPTGPDFQECVQSILNNEPAALLIVTVGTHHRSDCIKAVAATVKGDAKTRISVSALSQSGKRRQVAHAVRNVDTSITILANDHVFWKSPNFLSAVLAPLENKDVGVVTPNKRVRRTTPGRWNWHSILNFIACNYLQRHNWELRASNAIDGGVFVVSGRTAIYRTYFLKDEELLNRFCDEKFFFGVFGGKGRFGPDDDNFLTREAMKKGWLIRFQDTEESTIETTLGHWPNFKGQLLRWARTTFRSNPVMLRDAEFLSRYTWSGFMVYWAMLVNFAALWDAALIASLCSCTLCSAQNVAHLVGWMILTKTIKLLPHFHKYPSDIPLMVFQIAFGYIHGLFKLWALVTFWDCDWSGRNLPGGGNAEEKNELDTSFILL